MFFFKNRTDQKLYADVHIGTDSSGLISGLERQEARPSEAAQERGSVRANERQEQGMPPHPPQRAGIRFANWLRRLTR